MFLPIVNLSIDGGPTEPVAVVYPASTISWNADLSQIIDELTNQRLPPSRILFICPNGSHNQLASAFESNQSRLADRLRATTHVAVAPYDCRGRVGEEEVIDLWSDDTPRVQWVGDALVEEAARGYLAQLVEETNAVLQAPPGYQFHKLSGNTSDIFLRAGNMARELDSLNVVSHMLLRHWPSSANTIYIDSSTILSYALELQKTICQFGAVSPAVQNFRSYEKSDSFMFPPDGDYLVVVSASTSGDLAKDLVNLHGADRYRIVHILGAGCRAVASTIQDSCLHFLDFDTPTREAPGKIVIGGEEFIPSYSEPRVVQLTKAHVNGQVGNCYKAEFYQRNLRLKHSGSSAGYGGYSLFSTMNECGALDSEGLEDWLAGRLIHEIPASVSLIVHLNDDMSRSLAKHISGGAGFLADKTCVPLREMLDFDGSKLKRGTSILIVAYEDPKLEQFTAAATMLRKWPEAHRHFVLAYGFPKTRAGFDKMKASLTRGQKPFFGWSEFSISEVGELDRYQGSFENYPVDLHASLDHVLGIDRELSSALRRYVDCDRRLFLPKLNGKKLVLRPGSVFFDGEYNCLTDEVVYLAVATAVQRAREAGDLDPNLRFDSNPFVASVIDPQMFSRYSDGVLQAALLRSLHPSELDFSGSTLLSRQVREVLVAIISNAGNLVGEAALEFMAALAVEKIRISKEDRRIVINAIMNSNGDLARIWRLFNEKPIF